MARARLDRFELGVLAALALLAFAVLGGLLVRVWTQGGVLSGADGFVVGDSLQYLNWVRQAGEQVLIENRFDLEDGPATLMHPGLLVSGAAYWLGASPVVAYLLWKPVAVAVLFAAALAVARRFCARTDDRRLALVLALFACSPIAAFVGWGEIGGPAVKADVDFATGELWPGSYLWGYPFTAIAVGLLAFALLAYERGRDSGSRRGLVWAAVAGLLVAWLQPWQGATFALVILAAELLALRRGRVARAAARDLAAPLAATALPLLYFLALSRVDPSWELAGMANDLPRWPWWVTVASLAFLAIPAAAGYAGRTPDFGHLLLRLWPLGAFVVFIQPAGTFPAHALQGMSLPLAVLAVLGLRRVLGERRVPLALAASVVLVLAVVGTAYRVDAIRGGVNIGRQPFFLEPGEHEALRWLDRLDEPGGVLTPAYLGAAVPAYAGRETWIGVFSWTPSFLGRERAALALFAGRLDPGEARALVARSGARFLLVDCQGRAELADVVEGFTARPVRFGCAAVYRVTL